MRQVRGGGGGGGMSLFLWPTHILGHLPVAMSAKVSARELSTLTHTLLFLTRHC